MFVFIDTWFVKQDIKSWFIQTIQFLMEDLKMKRKRVKKFDLPEWGFEPRIFEQFFRPWFEFSGKVRMTGSNPDNLLKEIEIPRKPT